MNDQALDSTISFRLKTLGRILPIIIGLLFLYLPTYYDLATSIWKKDEYSHGPLILAVVLWLFWRLRNELVALKSEAGSASVIGSVTLFLGLLLYALGRSQDILLFEVGSQIFVLFGVSMLLGGWSAVKITWFPIFFIVFLIPIPGFMLDMLTGPLKHYVSVIVENILYYFDYPIARDGVIITIGAYQLLIADACSGLNSMYSLTALGLLYLYLFPREGYVRSMLFIATILPIAFIANVSRVIALVLITYYVGDEMGQGFLHDFAGILEFIIALMCLMLIGKVLSGQKSGNAQ